MKFAVFTLLCALATATVKADVPIPRSSFANAIQGRWSCTTSARANVTSVFRVDAAGNVSEHQTSMGGAHVNTYDQQFTYDVTSNTWIAHLQGPSNDAGARFRWTFTGSSPGLDGPMIVFTGTQDANGSIIARERYIFTGGTHFDYVSEATFSGQWFPTYFAECDLLATGSARR